MSPVTASSSAGHPASLSSTVAAASSTSFGFSPLAYVFSGAVLLLAGFHWGLVVPAQRVF